MLLLELCALLLVSAQVCWALHRLADAAEERRRESDTHLSSRS